MSTFLNILIVIKNIIIFYVYYLLDRISCPISSRHRSYEVALPYPVASPSKPAKRYRKKGKQFVSLDPKIKQIYQHSYFYKMAKACTQRIGKPIKALNTPHIMAH